jgi:hypothetical protein
VWDVYESAKIRQRQKMADDDRSAARRGGRKDRKLEQFVEGLLSAPTVESAAASAGISARTAWRWMQDPAVVQHLAKARRQGMQHAMTRLQAAASRSVDCLCAIQQDGESESARVSAARCILEQALRAVEIGDIQERLEKLEQIAKTHGAWRDPNHDRENQTSAGKNRSVNGPA